VDIVTNQGSENAQASKDRHPADAARRNGWEVGTRLVGDEGYGPTVIRITAIGERSVLAVTESHNGKPPKYGYHEGSWTFDCREWKRAAE
jgi:hypothetical protein